MNAMTDFANDWFPTIIGKEFFYAMCGRLLGSGVSRFVFECARDPSAVVKIEVGSGCFQNVHEWDVWTQHNAGPTILATKWLAPCISISDSGLILIQKKTKPVPFDFKLPAKVPAIFSDLKRDNWGIYKGRLVAHDYGRHNAIAASSGAMKKAQWIGAVGGRFEPLKGMLGATKAGVI